jgi:hypothetical protein
MLCCRYRYSGDTFAEIDLDKNRRIRVKQLGFIPLLALQTASAPDGPPVRRCIDYNRYIACKGVSLTSPDNSYTNAE